MTHKAYTEPYEIEAIIMGYLINTENKITTARFNKLAEAAGLDKVNQQELFSIADYIEGDETLSDILEKSRKGEIDLAQIVKYGTDDVRPINKHNVFNIITPHIKAKYRHQKDDRAFNKLRREGAYAAILADEIKEVILEELENHDLSHFAKQDPNFHAKINGGTLIAGISDWHVGATIVDHPNIGYGYNYDILNRRLEQLVKEVATYADLFKVENIRVYFGGDLVENTNMRNHQDFDVEFNLSEQIVMATKALFQFLTTVEKIRPVRFGIVNGNHDRLQGDKKQKIYNDSVAYIVLEQLEMLQEAGALANTQIIDNRKSMHLLEDTVHLNDREVSIAMTHGDFLKRGAKIRQLINKDVDILFTGHLHNASINQEEENKWHIQMSSIMGSNSYSSENMYGLTKPSQSITILTKENSSPIMYNPILL